MKKTNQRIFYFYLAFQHRLGEWIYSLNGCAARPREVTGSSGSLGGGSSSMIVYQTSANFGLFQVPWQHRSAPQPNFRCQQSKT